MNLSGRLLVFIEIRVRGHRYITIGSPDFIRRRFFRDAEQIIKVHRYSMVVCTLAREPDKDGGNIVGTAGLICGVYKSLAGILRRWAGLNDGNDGFRRDNSPEAIRADQQETRIRERRCRNVGNESLALA